MRNERRNGESSSLIIEVDNRTYDVILNRGKINIGWRKCIVFSYVSVIRCFKCWGYFHIARNCVRQVTCHKCAESHKESDCKSIKKKCVNCMHKIQTYNLKISDEHDALDLECPTYKKIVEEEKRKLSCYDNTTTDNI